MSEVLPSICFRFVSLTLLLWVTKAELLLTSPIIKNKFLLNLLTLLSYTLKGIASTAPYTLKNLLLTFLVLTSRPDKNKFLLDQR